MSQIGLNCTLHLAQGATEPCTGERCAFWESGGAVAAGGCLIERLGVELRRGPDLAARDRCEAEAAHREFSRRIGYEL